MLINSRSALGAVANAVLVMSLLQAPGQASAQINSELVPKFRGLPTCQGETIEKWYDCRGIHKLSDGRIVDSEWLAGKMHGFGAEFGSNGKLARIGNWRGGLADGVGIEFDENGKEKNRGYWRLGEFQKTDHISSEIEQLSHIYSVLDPSKLLAQRGAGQKSLQQDSLPRLDFQTCEKPVYPESARTQKVAGSVIVSFRMDADGIIREASIYKSSGETNNHKALDHLTLAAVLGCKGTGGIRGGQAYGLTSKVTYNWTLQSGGSPEPGIQRPQSKIKIDQKYCAAPKYNDAARRAEAQGVTIISFQTASDGKVIAAQVEKSAGPTREHKMLDRLALEAIRSCRVTAESGENESLEASLKITYVWKITEPRSFFQMLFERE